jgi:hypothetical protein
MKAKQEHKFGIIVLFALLVFGFNEMKAQNFSAKDIDGNWIRDDGMGISITGTAMFAEGSKALVMFVGKSGWPESTAHYAYKFQHIKYVSGNTWKAINYKHRVETGVRIEDGEVSFTMSDDKKSFKASGYTYTKN